MKNIKTKGLLFAATMFAAQMATAGLLLFEAGTDYVADDDLWFASIYSSTDSAASSDDTVLTIVTGVTDSSTGDNYSSTILHSSFFDGSTTAAVVADTSDEFSALWYYVNVYSDYGTTLVAQSVLVSGVDLVDANNYTTAESFLAFAYNSTQPATFTASTANVVPEPTGGLLVLMGAALLGLKRKRLA